MIPDHVEAILLWSEQGAAPEVAAWFEARGLQVAAMRQGLILSGPRSRFEAIFALELERLDPPVSLAVPAPLRGQVSAISIPNPRRYSGAGGDPQP